MILLQASGTSVPEIIQSLGDIGIGALVVIAGAYVGLQYVRGKPGRNGNGNGDAATKAVVQLTAALLEDQRTAREAAREHALKSAEAYRQNTREHEAVMRIAEEILDHVAPRGGPRT